MSELDNGHIPAHGGGSDGPAAEPGPLPFFPAPHAPPGPPGTPGSGIPLGAPVPAAPPVSLSPNQAPSTGRHSQTATEAPATPHVPAQAPPPGAEPAQRPADAAPASSAVVKGRIKVADEVVEKIAALAALEVAGIAGLGAELVHDIESARDRMGVGQRRGDHGVQAKIQDNEVSLDVTVVVEYGSVVMEVAKAVKSNVARVTSRMLGMRVTSVNITVDDVHIPGDGGRPRPARGPADPA